MKNIRVSWILLLVLFVFAGGVLFADEHSAPELPIPPLADFTTDADGTKVFSLNARKGTMEFFPGKKSRTMGYNGNYLGPTIRVSKGDSLEFRVKNSLGEPTTVHWHGGIVPGDADGGPHQVILPEEIWNPRFDITQSASTLWYHPHKVGTTAEQAYKGLAGLFIVDDEVSDNLNLPRTYGVDDIPLVLQERRFSSEKSVYNPGMHDFMSGYKGNVMVVNGAVSPFAEVRRSVRFRVLNGSNATVMRISFDKIRKFYQIASDSGFLEEPVERSSVVLSPGERAELLVNFPKTKNRETVLKVETNEGRTYQAVRFRSEKSREPEWDIPKTLTASLKESKSVRTRQFSLSSGMGGMMSMSMQINGREFDIDRIDETAKTGDVEIWNIKNTDKGMMRIVHNFHVHGVAFYILSIDGKPPANNLRGPKDTVLLNPGQRAKIIMKFENPGVFMYHCHLLEHEESGMMGQFKVL